MVQAGTRLLEAVEGLFEPCPAWLDETKHFGFAAKHGSNSGAESPGTQKVNRARREGKGNNGKEGKQSAAQLTCSTTTY